MVNVTARKRGDNSWHHNSQNETRVPLLELLNFRSWDCDPCLQVVSYLRNQVSTMRRPLKIFRVNRKLAPALEGQTSFSLNPRKPAPACSHRHFKARAADLEKSILDTRHYANAIHEAGQDTPAVAVWVLKKNSARYEFSGVLIATGKTSTLQESYRLDSVSRYRPQKFSIRALKLP